MATKTKTKENPNFLVCPGSKKKPDKRLKTKKMWSSYTYRPVDKHKCKVCGKHVQLDKDGNLNRHGKKVLSQEQIEAKQRKDLLAEGMYTLCAECEQPVFEEDYLCSVCRSL